MNKIRSKQTYFSLFFTFFKIGAFTFGGGYAMIPLLQRETIEKHQWISEQDMLDIIAVAESTPGPIAINSSTFIGYRTAGFRGALISTLGIILPSFGIMLLLSVLLRQFEQLKVVSYAFNGIRAGVLALILKAFLTMGRQCPKNPFTLTIMISAFAAVAVFNVNVLLVILICAAAGILTSCLFPHKWDNNREADSR